MQICPSEKCFGCSICADSCPVSAIKMCDDNGFYRPIIDEEKCISCGKCKRICISNETINLPVIDSSVSCYAVYSRDDQLHFEASSGGLCTELSKAFIESGGIVVGAWWNHEKQLVEHRICETIAELEYIKKSKYVQSKTEGIYKKIADIINIKKCLFIGVPCQVYALKQFINTNTDNLYCVDLLCHGGSSPKCFKEHLNQICKGKVQYISFRGGKDDCALVVNDEKGKKVHRGPQYSDPYFNYFMEHVIFQRKCFECPFAGKKRIGDLTTGDFWGLSKDATPTSGGYGINMLFENNNKGTELLDMINKKIVIQKRDATEAIAGNETLQCPTPMPERYTELWKQIDRVGFVKALDIYSPDNYKKRMKLCKRQTIRRKIKNTLKMVLPDSMVTSLKIVKKKLKG